MRLLSEITWVRPVRFYVDEVLDPFVEDGGDIVGSVSALEEAVPKGMLDI